MTYTVKNFQNCNTVTPHSLGNTQIPRVRNENTGDLGILGSKTQRL